MHSEREEHSLSIQQDLLATDCGVDEDEADGKIIPRSQSRFDFWFPTWEVWRFRRTLSYWIAMMYLEGSINFIVGAAFSMTNLTTQNHVFEKSLVGGPYFVGGVAFTIGSYAGMLEVINVPNKDDDGVTSYCFTGRAQWMKIREFLSWEPMLGYLSYMIGAILFNVNTLAGFLSLSPLQAKLIEWLPAVLGSVFFTVGGVLECYHNRVWHFKPHDSVHWLSLCNTVGALLFLFAATSGLVGVGGALSSKWMIDFTYLLGSIFFMVGAFLALWMWKSEHYGLGLIRCGDSLSCPP